MDSPLYYNLFLPTPCTTNIHYVYISSVQSLSRVQFSVTPWTTAHQASLSNISSRSPPKLMSIESAMPSNHLTLWNSLLLPSIFPSTEVFSSESVLHIRRPKYWNFSFSKSPSNECSRLTGLISLLSKGLSRVFSSTTVWKHQFFGAQSSLWSISHNERTTFFCFLLLSTLESVIYSFFVLTT